MIKSIAILLFAVCGVGCASAEPERTSGLGVCMTDQAYVGAAEAYENGVTALGRKEFRAASKIFDHGLHILGDNYFYDGLVDDTGIKLVIAQSEESKGVFEVAANIKGRVLDSRLEAFRAKNKCNEKSPIK